MRGVQRPQAEQLELQQQISSGRRVIQAVGRSDRGRGRHRPEPGEGGERAVRRQRAERAVDAHARGRARSAMSTRVLQDIEDADRQGRQSRRCRTRTAQSLATEVAGSIRRAPRHREPHRRQRPVPVLRLPGRRRSLSRRPRPASSRSRATKASACVQIGAAAPDRRSSDSGSGGLPARAGRQRHVRDDAGVRQYRQRRRRRQARCATPPRGTAPANSQDYTVRFDVSAATPPVTTYDIVDNATNVSMLTGAAPGAGPYRAHLRQRQHDRSAAPGRRSRSPRRSTPASSSHITGAPATATRSAVDRAANQGRLLDDSRLHHDALERDPGRRRRACAVRQRAQRAPRAASTARWTTS